MTKIVFYVVVFDQIGIQISWAHQNDRQNLSFMRDVNEAAKKMARNGLKIAKSLGCAFHFESEFICLPMFSQPIVLLWLIVKNSELLQPNLTFTAKLQYELALIRIFRSISWHTFNKQTNKTYPEQNYLLKTD